MTSAIELKWREAMTAHLPESQYLAGERAAELEEAQGDGRELWSPIDNNLLYTAEELDQLHEYEGEALAEYGADEFYGCGAASFNSCDALFLARERLNAQFRRTHRGMSKGEINAYYYSMFARSV
jgi:hypothetical protein